MHDELREVSAGDDSAMWIDSISQCYQVIGTMTEDN